MLGLRWKGKKNFAVAYKPINILLLLDWVKHPDEYDVTWLFVVTYFGKEYHHCSKMWRSG